MGGRNVLTWQMAWTAVPLSLCTAMAWAQESGPYYRAQRVAFGATFCVATGLNDAGDIVGTYQVAGGITRLYLRDHTTGVSSIPAAVFAGPYSAQRSPSINSAGEIAFTGSRFDDNGLVSRAVILSQGTFTEVAPISGTFSDAARINNLGHATGRAEAGPASVHAFLFASGSTIDLGQIEPPFGMQFQATGLNDADVVVGVGDNASGGSSGFLWDGAMMSLGGLRPAAINNDGVMCGATQVGQATRAFIRMPSGEVSILPTLGGRDSQLVSINAAGHAAGFSLLSNNSAAGIVWRDGTLSNLNDWLDRASRKARFSIASATMINASGQILASDGSGPLLLTPTDDCPADFNEDGGVDGADVAAFFVAWERGDILADVSVDGGVDAADVEVFFNAWEAGGC
ncbi:MAG: hypothetical protein NTV94_06210 [Planctomycetota bacterium]|nr:hypothetical protein [Planctomycetota bacterium]